jgi:hypothetical protein
MTMRTFVEFWRGMFFLVSTLTVSVIFYLVVVKWQPLWTEGFKDFGHISEAIMHLDETAKPVAEMAPLMRKSMFKMQQSMETIEEINPNVKEMTYTINRMTWVMDQRMGMMNNGMDRVGDKLSPPGMMMPFNW